MGANSFVQGLAGILAQINPMLAIAVNAINTARALRDAARASAPDQPLEMFPTDAELIQQLITDAGLGRTEAAEFRAWLKTLEG